MTLAAELGELIGEDNVSVDATDLRAHSHDAAAAALIAERSGAQTIGPTCVVRPTNTDQVVAIVKWASSTATPLIPFGGGSGVCGAVAPDGGVVVDMTAMNTISTIDEKSRLVTAQAGVTGPQLSETLASTGFMLGHEPQSIDISTVGGWVSTRATGQLSARYGGIEDLIAGLETVLPDGTVARTSPVARRATGPDVASLMIGAEGSLGIVTEVVLRVSPFSVARMDRCLRFEHMTDGVAACCRLAQSDLRPTLVRLYDSEDATIFLRNHPDETPGPLMLLSFDGFQAEKRINAAVEMCAGQPGNVDLVAHWWAHRNDAVEEYRKLLAGEGILGPHAVVDTIEVAGTWTSLRDIYHSLKDALTPLADIAGCHLSHIYPDGACLYFTLASTTESDEDALSLHARWWEKAMRTCLDAGGTISHHHGVGRVKAEWLPAELGEWHRVLVAVKRALDPKNIMNPGVLGL